MNEERRRGRSQERVSSVVPGRYEGEIFCLLGHNGAGKTTAIHCLTGLLVAEAGRATCYGMDVDEFRRTRGGEVGFCPQHNVLWDDLTVMEHFKLFDSLKNSTAQEESAGPRRAAKLGNRDADSDNSDSEYDEDDSEWTDLESLLKDLNLLEKQHALARELSPGLKRMLSVGLSFVKNPKFVLIVHAIFYFLLMDGRVGLEVKSVV